MDNMTTIFLDLEETVIESWSKPDWLVQKVEIIHGVVEILQEKGRTLQLGLMSWAVWDDVDKAAFNERFRGLIETAIQLKFSDDLVLSMDDWISLVMMNAGLRLSRSDIRDLGNKPTILFWLRNAQRNFPKGDIILIDDEVNHDDCIVSPENNRKITTINIDNLVKLCRIGNLDIF